LAGLDPDPARHQIVELPPIKPLVIEHQLHCLTCDGCGAKTRAKLPEGVSTSGYGPRLTAFVGLLTGSYRIAKRPAQCLMAEGFGVKMSLGTVVNLGHQCSQAVRVPVDEARAFVKEQPVINADETGWKTKGQRRYLWVAVTHLVTVFLISISRSKAVAQQLLGTVALDNEGKEQVVYQGTLGTDRYGAYTWVGVENWQICWAHLRRDFQKMVDTDDGLAGIGQGLIFEHDQIFRLWHRVRDGTLSRADFARDIERHRHVVKMLLEAGSKKSGAQSGMCAEIVKVEGALWSFVWREGVEPTNNGAERAVRPAVQWRKGSGGSQSWQGEHFVARMLTVQATLRSQGRDVLQYLTEAVEAARTGLPAPSLLPHHGSQFCLVPSSNDTADLATAGLAG
jgi:transposase